MRLCDSDSVGQSSSAYTQYIQFLYSQGLSTLPMTIPDNCNQFDLLNNIANTLNPLQWVPGLGNADAGGRHAYCDSILWNLANSKKGVGLTVSWPSSIPNSYLAYSNPPPLYVTQTISLNTDPTIKHDFVAKTYRTTVWTSLSFAKPDTYLLPGSSSPSDAHQVVSPSFQSLPSVVVSQRGAGASALSNFTLPLQSTSHILKGNTSASCYDDMICTLMHADGQAGFQGLENYIVFPKAMLSKFMQVQSASGMQWGIYTSGCNPPVFTISVNWKFIDALHCNQPYIYVTDITEDTSFACSMQFSTNQLRSFPDTTTARAALLSDAFAIATSIAGGKVLNSQSHVQNIMDCIFPSNPSQFTKWGRWDKSSPGACMLCLQQQFALSDSTPIPRACDRSKGELSDCCFTCSEGYTSLTYLDTKGVNQQHCQKTCSPGSTFDNIALANPTCIACPAGKFTYNATACVPCSALGFSSNSIVSPQGCMECGARAQATAATSCTPCSDATYLPPGAAFCRPCDDGYVLKTAASADCTPCPPGFADMSKRCLQCAPNMFKASEGPGVCQPCPSGTQAALNRTLCVPCTDINLTIAPLAIYKPNISGCAAMCNPRISYLRGTNPYAQGGCRPCSELTTPLGMYPSQQNCAVYLHCINVPLPNSTALLHYTGSGNASSQLCPWQCNPGYILLQVSI